MKKLVFFIFIFSSLWQVSAGAINLQDAITKGNQAYSDGEYTAAAEQYEQVVSEGYESAGLYFNLGNAYFKLNNIPAAILFYEKARKLDPTDENIRFNLELANSRIIDKIDPLPEFFLKSWLISFRNLYSSDQWAKTGVIAFVLMLFCISIFIISRTILFRKLSFMAGSIFLVIMIFSFLMSYSGYREYEKRNTAIVFTPTVTVKSSPTDKSVDLFVIHEGTKIYITDHVESWSEIRLANGNVGWIENNTFRVI